MASTAQFLSLAEAEVSRRLRNFPALRSRQKEVLHALADGENAFAGLPTGYGKSLCYWAPSAAWGWRVWVVSPLISLIQDQALACEAAGLEADAWHSGLSRAERERMRTRLRLGEAKLVFLSPERFLRWWESGFVNELELAGRGPDLLALDEMHCLEEWRGFRGAYGDLFTPIRRLTTRGVRLLGLSASFSRSEADLWMREFCPSHRFVGEGLGRENLVLTVKAVETESERWLALASSLRNLKRPHSALVYCATRTECEETSRWLRSAGFPACSYHAGLPGFQRALRSRGFREGALRIVCATSAFGMGVDYPWVDRVIHFSLPYSLEAYWQEAGRAGRNGEEAHALAIWRRSEITRARWMKPEEKARFFALWAGWASGACRKRVVAESLGIAQDDCGVCDICRRETGSLPAWLQDIGSDEPVWWLQTEAQPREWAKRRIFPD